MFVTAADAYRRENRFVTKQAGVRDTNLSSRESPATPAGYSHCRPQEEVLVSTEIEFDISLVLKKSCLRKLATSPRKLLYYLSAIRSRIDADKAKAKTTWRAAIKCVAPINA